MDRARLSRELGLGPLWRLRKARAGAPAPEQMPTVVAQARVPVEAVASRGLDWNELCSAVAECRRCRLCESRRQAVLGVGDVAADWLFVGEGPGAEEDARGEPFVGQAGKLLDNMLAAIGLQRGNGVFIANVLKCRPPQNRDPNPHEVNQCEPFLLRQIELLQPKLIVAVGRIAAQSLLKTDARIGALRGKVHSYHGVPLIITYHPAYLLRSQQEKAKAWQDLCLARATFAKLQR